MTTYQDEQGENGTNPQASALSYEEVNRSGEGVVNPLGPESVNSDSTPVADQGVIERYLRELFLNVPGGIEVCEKRGQAFVPRTYLTIERRGENKYDGIAEAARRLAKMANTPTAEAAYVRMTTLATPPGRGQRGGAKNASSFTSFWSDGDYGTDGHAVPKDGELPLPPDAETVREIYRRAGFPEPSIEVNSGGGINWIWILDTPVDITDPEVRESVRDASRRCQKLIAKTAKEMGYQYGAGVYNLDRLMRPPGVVNRKLRDKPRQTSGVFTGARYSYDELTALFPVPPGPVQAADGTWIDPVTGEIIREVADSHPSDGSLRPGDDFNQRADWHELLVSMRWTYSHTVDGVEYWIRPGKETGEAHGASLGHIPDKLFVFTDGAGIPDWRAYDKFSFYTFATYYSKAGVDLDDREQVRDLYRQAASDLRGQGYGDQLPTWVPSQREDGDMFAGQLTADGHVIAGTPLAEAVAPSADWTGHIEVPLSEAEQAAEQEPPGGGADKPTDDGNGEDEALPIVDITNERDALHNLVREIARGKLPETYVRDGRLVHVGVVSGARTGRRKATGAAAERQAPDMTASQMRALIAKHMVTVSYGKNGPVPKLPTEALCKSILAMTEWHTMPDLVGLTAMPFVRADGTVCQCRGYDPDTGLWLNVDDGFPEVPVAPNDLTVAEAYDLIVNEVLANFPWVSDADRANFIALLLTPMLRLVTDCPSPLGVITAAAAGSGKTLLAMLISLVYGGNGETSTLSRDDDETVKKFITSQLMNNPHLVVTFDNIGVGHTLDSPVLAQLLTSRMWADRALGGNDIVTRENNKLWLVTGNNVRIGGDIASRSVFVRIDPRMERPDKRDTSQFAVGNLDQWLQSRANRDRLAWALMVLVRAWAAAGSPEAPIEMRTYTPWARAMGGLLAFHEINGFLDNLDEVNDADDEANDWGIFLTCWRERFGDRQITSAQLLADYQNVRMNMAFDNGVDPWQGVFPVVDAKGNPPNAKGLGRRLLYKKDAPKGGWVLRQHIPKGRASVWYVEASEEALALKEKEAAMIPMQGAFEDY